MPFQREPPPATAGAPVEPGDAAAPRSAGGLLRFPPGSEWLYLKLYCGTSTADAFHFVYQPLIGDGQIIVRVRSLDNTNTYAKAGVMIRQNLGPSAAHVILDLRPTNDLEFMIRPNEGAQTTFLATAVQTPPTWLRLVRSGATLNGFVSADGRSGFRSAPRL